MPVPDSSGDWAGWLQSLLANQGAAQPYAPGATPTYGTLPGGTMPGGQVMGRTATTPGQPSMGYPAVGQAAGRPSVAPGTQAAPPGQPQQRLASGDAMVTGAPPGYGMPPSNANMPYAASPFPNANALGSSVTANAPAAAGQGGIGSDYAASFPVRGPLAAPAGSALGAAAGPVDPSIIARQKMAASPAATSTAAPAAAPNRFATVQRPNMPASGYSPGAPMMTALDLSRLFGRA
jgi:hypothetical protein